MPAMARTPRRHSLAWLQGLACGTVAALMPGMALLLGVLLLPVGLALLYDRQTGRPVARAVLLCGAAGVVTPVIALWNGGNSVEACVGLLGDLRVVGTAWSAAAAGWLLAELAPVAALVLLELSAQAKAARLRAERAALVEEWGLEPGSEGGDLVRRGDGGAG